jgi:hypothetical protein
VACPADGAVLTGAADTRGPAPFRPLPRRAGQILYRARADGRIWGEERFSILRGADGVRTLGVECEMAFGADHVIRQSTLSVDAAFQPVDAYVRIENRGARVGMGWFHFTDTTADCESWTDALGRIRQRMPIVRPMRGFGIHALISDGWLAAGFPFDRGPGHLHRWPSSLLHSLHHFGATGPMLVGSSSGLLYEGEESIDVPAGRFRCHRLAFAGMTNDHPPYRMWISTDGDFLYVRGEVAGYMDSVFELTELTGEPLGWARA